MMLIQCQASQHGYEVFFSHVSCAGKAMQKADNNFILLSGLKKKKKQNQERNKETETESCANNRDHNNDNMLQSLLDKMNLVLSSSRKILR